MNRQREAWKDSCFWFVFVFFSVFVFNSKPDRPLGGPHFICSLLLSSVRMLILESGSLMAILFYIGNEEMPPTKLHVTRVTWILKQHFLHWICQILASTFSWGLSRLQTQSMRSGWGNRQIPFYCLILLSSFNILT